MNFRPKKFSLLLFLITLLTACGETDPNSSDMNSLAAAIDVEEGERWYSESRIEAGRDVFREHCSECHGEFAQGTVMDWRSRLDDGSFPPPPLNGSAHAWHHPLPVLLQVINEGGIPLGGKMPAFSDVLNDDQKLAAIAYFQNFWSDEIYQQWEQMGGVN